MQTECNVCYEHVKVNTVCYSCKVYRICSDCIGIYQKNSCPGCRQSFFENNKFEEQPLYEPRMPIFPIRANDMLNLLQRMIDDNEIDDGDFEEVNNDDDDNDDNEMPRLISDMSELELDREVPRLEAPRWFSEHILPPTNSFTRGRFLGSFPFALVPRLEQIETPIVNIPNYIRTNKQREIIENQSRILRILDK